LHPGREIAHVRRVHDKFYATEKSICQTFLLRLIYPDHDRIELYVKEKGDKVVISDLGETMRHLDTLGFDVVSNRTRLFQAQHIADGLKVNIKEGIIFKDGDKNLVGDLLFDVLAACKAIADLVYGSRAYEPATFENEVIKFLQEKKFEVESRVPILGESGSSYKVSLKVVTPKREALIAAVSPKSPTGIRHQINATFRMWSDVNHGSWKISLLNDQDFIFRQEDVLLLKRVSPIYYWTQRDDLVSALEKGTSEN